MANIQQFSTIKSEVNVIKDKYFYENSSRAFIHYYLENIYLNDDVSDYITDGTGDHTIDAYYIEDNTITLFQFKYTESFEVHKKNCAIGDNDMGNISEALKKIWNGDAGISKRSNEKTRDAIKLIQEKLKEPDIKICFYLVSNFETTIHQNSNYRIKEFRDGKDFNVELNILNIENLIKKSIAKNDYKDISLQYTGLNRFDKTNGNIRALIAEVNAKSLLEKLIDSDTKMLDETFFDENVRFYLSKNKINKNIEESARSSDNQNFFFYNNGITVVCSEYSHNSSSGASIMLKKFQIVNGSQTIHSLYNVFNSIDKDKLDNVDLLMRVYEVKNNREIGQNIARYTNTQNPVKNRDILSNDEIQVILQKQLLLKGYYYERKKNEYKREVNKIDSEALAQILVSYYNQKPGVAKNKKTELFGSLYEEIFNTDKITAEYVLEPFNIYKEIQIFVRDYQNQENNLEGEDLKNLIDKKGFISYASYYILAIVKSLKNKNIDKNNLELINESADLISDHIKMRKEKDPKFNLPYVFKNETLLEEINKLM